MMQTPQTFRYPLICQAYERVIRQHIRDITDDAMVVECGTVIKRRGWDSNPCALADKRFSRPPRYDHFDTSPCVPAEPGLAYERVIRQQVKNITDDGMVLEYAFHVPAEESEPQTVPHLLFLQYLLQARLQSRNHAVSLHESSVRSFHS